MQHRLTRDDIDTAREVSVLQEQINALRDRMRTATGDEKKRIKGLIAARTDRLREVDR